MVDITGSIILPILFLVILQLCDIARSIDLTQTTEEDFWVFPIGPGIPFGPHALIHVVNYLSLSLIYMALSEMYSGNLVLDLLWNQPADPALYLLIVAFLILALLPILEISKYGKADAYSRYPIPESFIVHLLGVGSLLVVSWLGGILRSSRPNVDSLWQLFEVAFEMAVTGPVAFLLQIILLISSGVWLICGLAFVLAVHSEMTKLDIEPGEYS